MEELSGIWALSPLGALVGFIALLGLFLARGMLVTRREVEARISAVEAGNVATLKAVNEANAKSEAQYEARLREYIDREGRLVERGDDWKRAYQTETQNSDEWKEQARASLEVGRTTKHVLESLPVAPQNRGHTQDMDGSDGI